MPYLDKQKAKEYKERWNKDYYKKNKALEKKRVFDRRKEISVWLSDYKSNLECKSCGEKTTACLDFHHVDGNSKDRSLSLSIKWGWGKNRIMKEIGKCVVLCSNCHRKLHAGLINLHDIARSANGRPNGSGPFNPRSNRGRAASICSLSDSVPSNSPNFPSKVLF